MLKLILVFISLLPVTTQAGLFSMAHFVEPGRFSLGIEPELTFTGGASLGINLKYTHGFTELFNIIGVVGTGGGDKNFRIGTGLVFDFFPDTEGQPGVGLAFQPIYYRRGEHGQLEMSFIPYLHKSLKIEENDSMIEPFIGVPFGLSFQNGGYKGLFGVSIGTLYSIDNRYYYVVELGVAINHTDTYFAGGIVYYH